MSYTSRNGFEKIEVGSEQDSWGTSEHETLDRQDECLDGVLSITVSGDRPLVAANTPSDELHFAILNITGGSGGRVLLPLKQSTHVVRNGATGNVTFTTNNSGIEVTILVGETAHIFCDGVNAVYAVSPTGTGIKAYADNVLVQAKQYADGLAFSASSLPTQSGNAGKFITTNGSTAQWSQVKQSDVQSLPADLTAIRNLALAASLVL